MRPAHYWLTGLIAPAAFALAACSESPRPYGARTSAPPPALTTPKAAPDTASRNVPAPVTSTAAPTQSPAPSSPAPATAVTPGTAVDVESKKGTDTGMVGGASGTVASGGKPGSGTASGGGTGPALSSGEQTENKK